jgi:hypothetical protein
VITKLAYFNDAQRQATKDAGRIAGRGEAEALVHDLIDSPSIRQGRVEGLRSAAVGYCSSTD